MASRGTVLIGRISLFGIVNLRTGGVIFYVENDHVATAERLAEVDDIFAEML